jgi:mannose-6-phosphate isomerase-like protein (cupin superfamily)
MDYVVVPMTTGKLHLKEPNGDRVAELTAGKSYTRLSGVEHEVINPGPGEFVFVEIELKETAPAVPERWPQSGVKPG